LVSGVNSGLLLAAHQWAEWVITRYHPRMTARIVLVRHGPSAHVERSILLDRGGVEAWREAYDAAGIQADARPPESLTRVAATATHVVASDLPRALGSAQRIGARRAILSSELLRESSLAIPNWEIRMPLGLWGMLISTAWFYRIARGTDMSAAEQSRTAAAADWLLGMTSGAATLLVVTHGVFRRMLSTELRARGWTCAERAGGYRHWSAWTFVPQP
jgi:broad specificity phosphatase PhoE